MAVGSSADSNIRTSLGNAAVSGNLTLTDAGVQNWALTANAQIQGRSPVGVRLGDAAERATRLPTAADLGIPNFPNPRQSMHIPPATDGRSVLMADPSDLLRGLHNGEFTILRQPKSGQVVVDFGRPIGEYWSNGARVSETQFGSVA